MDDLWDQTPLRAKLVLGFMFFSTVCFWLIVLAGVWVTYG